MRFPLPALKRCRVLEVHDGDTVKVLVDKAEDDMSIRWIRLKGVYAPELSQLGGQQCRGFTGVWLAEHGDGSDWPYMLETFRTARSDTDVKTLSRYVGSITAADGASLNVAVQGYVTAQGYPGGTGS